MRIWTDEEYLETDGFDAGEMASCMYFKAANIKAKADPELFTAAGDMIALLWKEVNERETVRRGRWKNSAFGDDFWRCSECNSVFNRNDLNYCPNCGAKMDKEEDAI